MNPIIDVTILQLRCLDAVVREGSFQAAAARLNRTHPTVFAAVKNLEARLGLQLLDRAGYRVALTAAGRSFHDRARVFLRDLEGLQNHAAQLAMGEESELNVVIGDLCPFPETLGLLRRFFDGCPQTRLHLHFEAISGPWERLLDDEADLIIHHVDRSDPRLECIDLGAVQVIPVAAPNFLPFPISDRIAPEQMRDHVQCVIRDSARHSSPRSYFVIEGARSWTVSDQLMKKEIILQGMGWGHMPTFLIEQELRDGRLIPITGRFFAGGRTEIVAARRRNHPHGPVAQKLWTYVAEQAAASGRNATGRRASRANARKPRPRARKRRPRT
jgi:DNA-binding transcriptional LysR family regulator